MNSAETRPLKWKLVLVSLLAASFFFCSVWAITYVFRSAVEAQRKRSPRLDAPAATKSTRNAGAR